MKILVTGNAGSGKTTLAKRLAAYHDLNWYGLDVIVWKENWQKTPAPERDTQIAKLITRPSWVIDGVSEAVLKAADEIVFLDFPRRVCLYRVAKRNARYLFSSRPELPDRCPEILIIPKLAKIIWRFPSHTRPSIVAKRSYEGIKFVHITNNGQLRSYLQALSG